MLQKQDVLVLNDGEKLSILIGRDSRSLEEIALAWGKTRQQIHRYTTSEILSQKVIKHACMVLNVPETVFDKRLNADSLLDELDLLRSDIERLKHTAMAQDAINAALVDRIKKLEDENFQLRILQN